MSAYFDVNPPLGRVFMFNKPSGYLTSCRDPRDPTVMEFFPAELRGALHPVGRLDRDTHGILLFTDDGRVDFALLSPERHVPKIYSFYAVGSLDGEKIRRIGEGVPVGGSGVVSRPASIRKTADFTVADIADYLPPSRRNRYLRNPGGSAFAAELELREGRHHQVKLMMRAVNCRVVYLRRISFAGVRLDENLVEGEYRPLDPGEYRQIEELVERAYL